MKVVADISTMSSTVTTYVAVLSALRKVSDSCAPRKVDCSAWAATSGVMGPIGGVPGGDRLEAVEHRNRPKKNGDCSRMGRHEENGLVPVRLYRSMVSCVIA